MLKSKTSEAGLTLIIGLIILVLLFGWAVNYSQRECKSNRDCGSESYCGSDFACHQYPNIQKTVIQYNFLWPSIIIGIAIVIAALIFRWNQIKPKEESKQIEEEQKIPKMQIPEEAEDISEPYYKSNVNPRNP